MLGKAVYTEEFLPATVDQLKIQTDLVGLQLSRAFFTGSHFFLTSLAR